MSDLKPCPFCGEDKDLTFQKVGTFNVKCNGCGAQGPDISLKKEDAADDWNRRPNESAPDLLAALEAHEDMHQRGIVHMTSGEVHNVHAMRRAAIAKWKGAA